MDLTPRQASSFLKVLIHPISTKHLYHIVMAWNTKYYTPHSRHTPPRLPASPPPSLVPSTGVVVNFDLLSHILEPPLSRMDQPPSTHYFSSRSSLSCLHQNPIYSPISRFCLLTNGALLTSPYRPSMDPVYMTDSLSWPSPFLCPFLMTPTSICMASFWVNWP